MPTKTTNKKSTSPKFEVFTNGIIPRFFFHSPPFGFVPARHPPQKKGIISSASRMSLYWCHKRPCHLRVRQKPNSADGVVCFFLPGSLAGQLVEGMNPNFILIFVIKINSLSLSRRDFLTKHQPVSFCFLGGSMLQKFSK